MISAIVLTHNEEENIKDCLESLKFCGEIIIVDDNSQDNTLKIAKKFNTKIFTHSLNGDFSAQRNFGLERAKGDWVLFLDADERIDENLAREIIEKTWAVAGKKKSDYPQGYYIRRRDFFWERELRHGETANLEFLRLARRDAGLWQRRVHEYWSIKGETQTLENSLSHYPHKTLREFVRETDYYSSLHAEEKKSKGEKSGIIKIALWPALKFIHNFIFRRGFLDGQAGVVMALMMSLHSYLAWSKLYLAQRDK
jgi:glycosyltransferase involved in cell wall biosynthesis